jgi:DNA helicase II / ATP-dependent DNA helicase PcrA
MDNKSVVISDEAYKMEDGPILLLAGPGTGKTWQLAHRIKFLTEVKEILPEKITVITFTVEAAKGMKMKLEDRKSSEFIEENKRPKQILTMHGLGYKIIKDHPKLLGLKKDFVLVEKEDIKKLLMRDASIILGYTEEDAVDALNDRTTANINPIKKSSEIIKKYEEILHSCNAIDYDDQINLACKLLETNEKIRRKYSQNTEHLLVDEYQDINPAQFALIELLSRDNRKGLFVVGDDDQSIYSFRGGNPEHIRSFKDNFGVDSVIVQMSTSRRCPCNILECASAVVEKFDSGRVPKGGYIFKKSDPGEIVLHDCPSDERESEIIGYILKKEMESLSSCETCKQLQERTCFILVPNKNYVPKIQTRLQKLGISFDSKFENQKAGFYIFTRFENWVNAIESDFNTRLILELIIEGGTTQLPTSKSRTDQKKKIRKDGLVKIATLWDNVIANNKNFFNVLKDQSENDDMLREIYEKMLEIKNAYNNSLSDFISKIIIYAKPWPSVDRFYEEIKRKPDVPIMSQKGLNVRILTMQSSKGLQAHTVFIIGLEQGVIPRVNGNNISEEARLLFVAMTRAEEKIHLFKCRRRTGAATYMSRADEKQLSSFIECLPKEKYKTKYHPPKSKLKKF